MEGMIPVVLFYGFLAADPAALAKTPQMRQALDYAKRIEPEIIAEQRRVCEIAAPTGQKRNAAWNSSASSKPSA